jgi:8-oxo-dGTP pyrophosphatase MutT (NUDIX family)
VLYSSIIVAVEQALKRPLPGAAAHERMAPRPRREWPDGFDRAAIRDAAVLVLLFPIEGRAHIVLTVRAGTLGRHGGQVSLPGGVIDPGETREQAALREAHEEVGVDPGAIRTLGALTPLEIPVSGFRLHPIVGAHDGRPLFVPAQNEVARVLQVDLERLQDPACLVEREVLRDGRTLTLPAFLVDGVEVWGATAMVLAEFLEAVSAG